MAASINSPLEALRSACAVVRAQNIARRWQLYKSDNRLPPLRSWRRISTMKAMFQSSTKSLISVSLCPSMRLLRRTRRELCSN